MMFRDSKIIFYVALLLIIFSVDLVAAIDDGNSKLPDLVTEIKYYSSNKDLSIDSVINLPESSFMKLNRYTIQPNEIFWLKVALDNRFAMSDEYFIHFYGHLDEVYLYQKSTNGKWTVQQSGILVPEKLKTVKGYIKDKIPFGITGDNQTILYLRIKNEIVKELDISRIQIIDSESFGRTISQTKQIQSFFLGIVSILCFFNLLLYLFTGTRIYLYYMLHAIFSSIYFIYAFQYVETGYLANHPEVSLYFFFSAAFIPVVYSWFLYESLKTDVKSNVLSIVRKYAITVSAFALFIPVIALFDFTTAVLVDDIYSIVNSIIIVLIVVLLFKKVSNTVKIILSGSLFLVVGVFLTVVLNFRTELPVHVYFFQGGFFIELIFFTVAINFMQQNERLAKIKAELKNTRLVNAKLREERKAQQLREQVQLKERDLATKAAVISQKETLIKSVTSQLEKQVQNNSLKIKDIKDVVSNLHSKIGSNFWDEFETHFIQVHPDFYKSLNKKYPTLTINERRLCAFIKLNLTTKEIANITKRNPESIHMTRSRLRKKMGLNKHDNLETIISTIS